MACTMACKSLVAKFNSSADSSVGRAEDCREAEILRSLVRVRVGGETLFLYYQNSQENHPKFHRNPKIFIVA